MFALTLSRLVAVSVIRTSLTVTLSGLLLVSTAVGVAARVENSTASVPERVLFIGNSHAVTSHEEPTA